MYFHYGLLLCEQQVQRSRGLGPSYIAEIRRDSISLTRLHFLIGTYDQGFTYCDIRVTVRDEKCDSAVLFLV